MMIAMRSRLFVLVLVAACGSSSSDAPGAGSGSGSARKARPDAGDIALPPVDVGSDGLPVVCAEWKQAIDKLATCPELPQNARDSLIAVYKDASAGWGQLPADAKKKLVEVCRAGADSVLKGARATCKW